MSIELVIEEALRLGNEGAFAAAAELLVTLPEIANVDALCLLGTCYFLGEGVRADGARAIEQLERSASLGSSLAMHNLGTLYICGAPGIAPNAQLGHDLQKQATAMGGRFFTGRGDFSTGGAV